MMTWTEDEEFTSRIVVTKLHDAVARLTHHDGAHASVRDLWLGGTPANRLIIALDNASTWEEAEELMLKTSGFPASKTSM